MKSIEIPTDGSCLGNPGPGGWAALLRYNGRKKPLSGGEPVTTNNRMELMAAIMALEALTEPCAIILHTDGRCELHDVASKNGTQLNGKKIDGPTRLQSGDQLLLCNRKLTFHVTDAPAG